MVSLLGVCAVIATPFAESTAAASKSDALWKMGASGVSSAHGNAFVVTAEYIGPTVSATNSEARRTENSEADPLPARLMLHTGDNRTNGTKFAAGYYRGTIFTMVDSRRTARGTRGWNTNLVSIFSSPDLTTLVVAADNGPVYSSTNAGRAWTANRDPGKYEFPLDASPDGSGLFAEVLLKPASRLAHSVTAQTETNARSENWYAAASATDGSQLVVTGSHQQPAPVLSISYSGSTAIVTWSSAVSEFVLQQNPNLTTTDWADVATRPSATNGLNQVVITPALGNKFYRLRKLSP